MKGKYRDYVYTSEQESEKTRYPTIQFESKRSLFSDVEYTEACEELEGIGYERQMSGVSVRKRIRNERD